MKVILTVDPWSSGSWPLQSGQGITFCPADSCWEIKTNLVSVFWSLIPNSNSAQKRAMFERLNLAIMHSIKMQIKGKFALHASSNLSSDFVQTSLPGMAGGGEGRSTFSMNKTWHWCANKLWSIVTVITLWTSVCEDKITMHWDCEVSIKCPWATLTSVTTSNSLQYAMTVMCMQWDQRDIWALCDSSARNNVVFAICGQMAIDAEYVGQIIHTG